MKKTNVRKRDLKKIESGMKSLEEMLKRIAPFIKEEEHSERVIPTTYDIDSNLSKNSEGGW